MGTTTIKDATPGNATLPDLRDLLFAYSFAVRQVSKRERQLARISLSYRQEPSRWGIYCYDRCLNALRKYRIMESNAENRLREYFGTG
jgi:hypothetical protein